MTDGCLTSTRQHQTLHIHEDSMKTLYNKIEDGHEGFVKDQRADNKHTVFCNRGQNDSNFEPS